MCDTDHSWSRRSLLRMGAFTTIAAQAGCLELIDEDSTDTPERAETPESNSESPSAAGSQWLVGVDSVNKGVRSGVEPITSVSSTDWQFQPQNGGYAVRGGPTVIGDSVFVGAQDRRLYALTRSSGEVQWAAEIDFYARATPAVTADTVYTTGYDTLYAVDRASGEMRWNVELNRIAGGTPVVADGTVVVGSDEGIHGVGASSGVEQWFTETEIRFDEGTTIADDDDIYLLSENGVLQALTPNGELSWRLTFERTDMPPVIDAETVYVGIDSWNGEGDPSLVAVDRATGDIRWMLEDGNRTSAPARYDETVYVWIRGSSTGHIYALGAASGEVRWRREYGGTVSKAITATDDAIYIGDGQGQIAQFDSASGEVEWSDSLNGAIQSGLSVQSGHLYAGTESGSTAALPIGGDAPVWTHETLSQFSRPAVLNEMVYIGSTDETVYALNPEDGEPMWATDIDSQITAAPAVIEELVLVTARNGTVYGFDRTSGEIKWTAKSNDSYDAAPTVVDDTVYVGGSSMGLHAIDATEGTENWAVELEGRVTSTPAVADGRVYAAAEERGVVALDVATGDRQWTESPSGVFNVSPVVAEDRVYACTEEGTIYAFDPADGTSEQVYESGERIRTTPAISNGQMYIGLGTNLFAVDLERGVPVWEAEGINSSITSSPTVTANTIYIGQIGQVSAHAIGSGEMRWSVGFDSWVDTHPTPSDHGVFVGADGLYRLE